MLGRVGGRAMRVFAMLAALCQGTLHATELPRCPQTITFGLYEHGRLYDAVTDRGIDKDVAEALARLSGCRFVFVVRPRARIWRELESGRLMMSGSAIPTPERGEFVWFATYMAVKNYVVVNAALKVNSASQFAANPQLRWGAVRSYRHGPHADEFIGALRAQGRVVEESDLPSLIRLFTRGRMDAFFAHPPILAKYLDELPTLQPPRVVDWFPEDEPARGALVFSKRHFSVQEMSAWRALVEKMRVDGTLKAIYERHLGKALAQTLLDFKPD